MTTCLDVLTRAYRAMGVVSQGGVPSGADAEDGLEQLQDIINLQVLRPTQPWTDVHLISAAAYTAGDGERINTGGYAATITLPTTYVDECGVLRQMPDLSRVQIIGGEQEGVYIYAASKGAWAQVDALALSDDCPFGQEDVRGLASMVAVAMVDEYGTEVSEITTGRALTQAQSFSARFYREVIVGVDYAYLRLSDMGERYGTDRPT